jgi:guanosine-3',5'-bis(diphosphate) 3'-pyrophosphohydrolase
MTTTAMTENRASFFNRLRPVLAPSDLLRVEVAYALAKHGHRHQERKELDVDGRPIRYFEHLRGTALVLIDELKIIDPDMVIACLMHDSLEDTDDISDRMLEHLFGRRVTMMVKLLTKEDPKENYYPRLMAHADDATAIIKGCDRLHNLRSMKDCSEEFVRKQLEETNNRVFALLDHRIDSDTTQPENSPLCRLRQMLFTQCRAVAVEHKLSPFPYWIY